MLRALTTNLTVSPIPRYTHTISKMKYAISLININKRDID